MYPTMMRVALPVSFAGAIQIIPSINCCSAKIKGVIAMGISFLFSTCFNVAIPVAVRTPLDIKLTGAEKHMVLV